MWHYLGIGIVTIIAGLVLRCFPAKKRYAIYGYRSRRAFSSKESWDFAQRYSGILGMKLGVASTAVGMFCYILDASIWIPLVIGTLSGLAIIPITEERLRKKRYS